MATYRQMVYMVLDLLKLRSDDAYYTERHVMFLLDGARAVLLERKYGREKGRMPRENLQEVCLDLEPFEAVPCERARLRSTERLPDLLGRSLHTPEVFTVDWTATCHISWTSPARFPYAGSSRWTRKMVYATQGPDGFLHLRGADPAFLNLRKVRVLALFAHPPEAERLSCVDAACDPLDAVFPLEEGLVPSCAAMAVQQLSPSVYLPEDKGNDAQDTLSGLAVRQTERPDAAGMLPEQQGGGQ